MAYEVLESLTKENVYNRLDSIEIFKKYCKNFHKTDKLFKSEFREEKKGSCMISWLGGDFYLKDFGGGGWRPIAFVMQKFGLSYREALAKINNDFSLGLAGGEYSEGNVITLSKKQYQERGQATIKIKKREWQQYDLDYWAQFGITKDTLELYTVVPISHFSINDVVCCADKISYSFEYYWDTPTHFCRKVYQPFNKRGFKWMGTGIGVVQGESNLPYHGELLIISKALKDVMCYHTMGHNSIAPTCESTFLNEEYFNKQKSRFKHIILQFDNDFTGLSRAKELCEKYGLKSFVTPEKDLGDTIKLRGLEFAKEFVRNELKNLLIL